jgi:hypothetical protein
MGPEAEQNALASARSQIEELVANEDGNKVGNEDVNMVAA